MKAIGSFACVTALVFVAAGCVSSAESVRRYAAEDLRCPATQINTQDLGSGAFRATGCGRSGFYMDNNAPASTTFASSGGTYFTVASASRH